MGEHHIEHIEQHTEGVDKSVQGEKIGNVMFKRKTARRRFAYPLYASLAMRAGRFALACLWTGATCLQTIRTAFAELIPDPCQNIRQVNLLRRGYAHLTDNLARLFSGSAKATRRTGTKNHLRS